MPEPELLQSMVICYFVIFALHQPATARRISQLYHSEAAAAATTSLDDEQQAAVECGAGGYEPRRYYDHGFEENHHYCSFGGNSKQSSHLIKDGFDAQPGQFPAYVYMETHKAQHTGGDDHEVGICGGSILDERHILTAAHCFHEQPVESITIYTGFISEKDHSRKYDAKYFCVPKEFSLDRSSDYDVAVLTLSEPIEFNERVQPICLPSFGLRMGQKVITVGMGLIGNRSEEIEATRLQALQLERVPHDRCGGDAGELEICAEADRGAICSGDSGGPILALVGGKQTVFGILARGGTCEQSEHDTSIYTDISRPEISSIINKCLSD